MSHGEGGLVIAFGVTFLHVLLLWQMSGEQFPDFIIMYFCRLYQSELNYKYWWSDRHLGTTARTSRRYIYSVTVIVDSSRSCDLCVICTFLDLLTPHYYNGQFTSIGACHNSCELICQQSSGTLNPGWSQDTIHGIIPTTMQWSFSGLNQIVYYRRCSDHHDYNGDAIPQDVKEGECGWWVRWPVITIPLVNYAGSTRPGH